MTQLAALDFILVGFAFAQPEGKEDDQLTSSQLLSLAGFIYALCGVLDFAMDPRTSYTGLTIVEASFLVILSLGVLFLHPDHGFVADIFADLSGGIMARRLLPVAIAIPVVLGWIRYEAQQFGLFSPEAGAILMVMMAVVLLLYEMLIMAQSLNRVDLRRQQMEEALAEANDSLEAKVAVRSAELNKVNERLHTELTERKLAEERLCESERQLRLIVEQIPAALWITDRSLRIHSASGSGLKAAHLRPESIIGKTVRAFPVVAEREGEHLAAHHSALQGKARSYETVLADRAFAVHLEPLHEADGEISGIIGVALDVTEGKKAQESISKLAAIVESSQDAIMGTSLDGNITSWNRAAEQMYGYSAEQALGKPLVIIIPRDHQEELGRIYEKLQQGELIRPFETVCIGKAGQKIDASLTVSPVKEPSGKIIGISAIAHDISNRKRSEQELRLLSARLLRVQDEERRYMARELHDTTIQGLAAAAINLSLVRESVQIDSKTHEALTRAAKLIEEAMREIRTFSYLLHPPLLDTMGLNSALRWYVSGFSQRSGIQVELNLMENSERMGKEFEITLFRVVQEALTNIHRHSGGLRATIQVGRTDHGLNLLVSDNGHGMDTETLEKVRSEEAALGVGIAGMKERVRQLGGRLEISSTPQGTTVKVTLPTTKDINETVAHLDRGRS